MLITAISADTPAGGLPTMSAALFRNNCVYVPALTWLINVKKAQPQSRNLRIRL